MRSQDNHENLKRNHGFKTASPAQFGITLAIVLGVTALLTIKKGGAQWTFFLTGSVIFTLISLLFPQVLGPLNWLWTRLGLLLARLTNPLILAGFYYLVLTPVALLYRFFSKQSFRTKYSEQEGTWTPHNSQSTMKQQF